MISTTRLAAVLVAVIGFVPAAGVHAAQRLELPSRQASSPTGAEFVESLLASGTDGDLHRREALIFEEITAGNLPEWMRKLSRVEVRDSLGGEEQLLVFWATPDYLAVGADDDFFRVPLSPQTAQRIADLTGTILPTPKMVDLIWAQASVRIEPLPIPSSDQMITVRVFDDHNLMVRNQLEEAGVSPGTFVSGIKKDVVVTNRLVERPGNVAIYGWHHPDGRPIQPLYLGHTRDWVDYSHGIRLVHRRVILNGRVVDIRDLLGDQRFAGLLSHEGVIPQPGYPLTGR